jgi:polysaccharide deacetylase 2 family uncharacterized protein YibQ
MWNRIKPRPKLTIHTTDRNLSAGQHVSGKGKYLAIALAVLFLLTHYFPSRWWLPEPSDFKPAAIPPAEREAEEVVLPAVKEEKPRPLIPYGPALPDWRRYAIPVMLDERKAKIAIVIDDMGVNRPKSREVIDLPSVLTLAFLPYANKVDEMAEDARIKGHELMVHMPMEPLNTSANPGPDALRTTMTSDELNAAIHTNLSKFGKYVGINNHMGSKFTQDVPALKELVAILKERGLFFLDSKTIASSQAYNEAKAAGVPAVERDVFLDDNPSLDSVRHQMRVAEAVARKKGFAVVIGHPKENTIQVLKEFLSQADAKGFQVVPLSAIVKMSETEKSYKMSNRHTNLGPAE